MNIRDVIPAPILHLCARILFVRKKLVFEARLDEIRRIPAKILVFYRYGNAADLSELSADVHSYSQDAKLFSFERLKAGDRLVLGEVGKEVVFYGWLMYGQLDMGIRKYLALPPDTVYSYLLFTVERQRGKKLCAAYFSFIQDALRSQGYRRVVSWVEARNRSSVRAHEGAGFRRIGSIWHCHFLFRSYFFLSRGTRAFLLPKTGLAAAPHRGRCDSGADLA